MLIYNHREGVIMSNKRYAFPFPAVKHATPVSSNKYFDIGFDDENEYGFLYYKDGDHMSSPIFLESAPRRPNPKITHEFYPFGLMIIFDDFRSFYNNSGQNIKFPVDNVEIFEDAIFYTKDNKSYLYNPNLHQSFFVGKRIDNEDGSTSFYFLTDKDALELEEDDIIELL